MTIRWAHSVMAVARRTPIGTSERFSDSGGPAKGRGGAMSITQVHISDGISRANRLDAVRPERRLASGFGLELLDDGRGDTTAIGS